ncbi:MAG TPA: SDR family oxidoreductase, partial [Abditibacterium sp.]
MKLLKTLLWGTTGLCALGSGAMALLRAKRKISFAGKVVFITGGSRGLGLVLARLFLAEGAQVAICGRTQADLDAALTELQKLGQARAYNCDIRDRAQINATILSIERELGPIDVLVNCAGVMTLGPLETMTLDDYENEMSTHWRAHLHTMTRVWPGMKARGGGRIVNISSIGGRAALPHLATYSSAKFASSALSQNFRIELAQHGVLVTTVWPMIMRLGSLHSADIKGQHKREFALANIFNAFPLTSMSAQRCAKGIVEACRVGNATYNPSKREGFFVLFQELCPNVV